MTPSSDNNALPVPVQPTVLLPRIPDAAPLAPPAALSAPPSMEGLLNALRQRWWLVLSLALGAGVLGGVAAWCVVPAHYSVETLLHIAPRSQGTYESDTEFLNFQRTQTAVVKSFPVILATLEKPGVAALPEVRDHDDAPEWLNKAIKTDTLLGPEIIRVTLEGDRGEDLAILLNELAQAYIRSCVSKDEARIQERIRQLQGSFQACSEELREKRLTLQRRERALDIPDAQTVLSRQQMVMGQITNLQNQALGLRLEANKIKVELIGAQLKINKPDDIPVPEYDIGEEFKLDPVVQQYGKDLVTIDNEIQKYEQVASTGMQQGERQRFERKRALVEERLEAYKKARRAELIRRLRDRLVHQTQDEILKLERQLDLNKQQQRQVESEAQAQQLRLNALRDASHPGEKGAADVVSLRDEVAQKELVLKKLGDEMGALQSQLPATPRVTQMELAKVPGGRKRDKQLKFSLVAALGLAGLVFLGMALLEFRFRRVYNADEVERGLGLPLIGTLPGLPPEARKILPGAGVACSREQVALNEAIDGIRTRVLHAASRGEALRVLMVASAVSGEGKTSLSMHLAASLARSGHKTLLIDGDLRNPAAHNQFGLPLGPGFSEALRNEVCVEDVVQPTFVEGLALLSAGDCDRRALRALGMGQLDGLFARLKEDFEFIVVDVCPVLPVTDALLIGRCVDGVILSVLRSVSRLPAVYAAQQRLQALDIRLLGAVVLGESLHTYGIDRYLEQVKE
jgi:capsular exopolysaccharide synthesis family protein